jgi:hypothetical protein
MRVAGVTLSTSAAALLASRLRQADHVELAHRIDWAVAADRADVSLSVSERGAVVLVLQRSCPEELEALRESLWSTLIRMHEL